MAGRLVKLTLVVLLAGCTNIDIMRDTDARLSRPLTNRAKGTPFVPPEMAAEAVLSADHPGYRTGDTLGLRR